MDSKARKSLERYRRDPASCNKRKLQRLLRRFGFEPRNGSKHIIHTHPDNPKLRFGLPYGKKISIGYVTDAIKEIDKFLKESQTTDS